MGKLVVLLIAIVVSYGAGTITNDRAIKGEIGYGLYGLGQLKKECEAELPRNIYCHTVVLHLPTASEE